MSASNDKERWVYVVVQNPGGDESIVGQKDSEHDLRFIPVFDDRETALQGLAQVARSPGLNYEIQAILYEELLKYAQKDGFLLFFLDASGRIVAKVAPNGRSL